MSNIEELQVEKEELKELLAIGADTHVRKYIYPNKTLVFYVLNVHFSDKPKNLTPQIKALNKKITDWCSNNDNTIIMITGDLNASMTYGNDKFVFLTDKELHKLDKEIKKTKQKLEEQTEDEIIPFLQKNNITRATIEAPSRYNITRGLLEQQNTSRKMRFLTSQLEKMFKKVESQSDGCIVVYPKNLDISVKSTIHYINDDSKKLVQVSDKVLLPQLHWPVDHLLLKSEIKYNNTPLVNLYSLNVLGESKSINSVDEYKREKAKPTLEFLDSEEWGQVLKDYNIEIKKELLREAYNTVLRKLTVHLNKSIPYLHDIFFKSGDIHKGDINIKWFNVQHPSFDNQEWVLDMVKKIKHNFTDFSTDNINALDIKKSFNKYQKNINNKITENDDNIKDFLKKDEFTKLFRVLVLKEFFFQLISNINENWNILDYIENLYTTSRHREKEYEIVNDIINQLQQEDGLHIICLQEVHKATKALYPKFSFNEFAGENKSDKTVGAIRIIENEEEVQRSPPPLTRSSPYRSLNNSPRRSLNNSPRRSPYRSRSPISPVARESIQRRLRRSPGPRWW
jgi:hypothetical protein